MTHTVGVSPHEHLRLGGAAEALLEAVSAISSDLDLRSVLTRIVEAATQLTEAQYGALGVIGADGSLVEFVTTGLTAEEHQRIGELPRGRGILGLLIHEPQGIRMTELAAHPASVGFPANHPPMDTFLGVPVRIRGTVFGNLYLTEKRGGAEFTEQDEQLVEALARAAGFVIENARAYGLSELRRRWLEASAELTETLQPPIELDQARKAITRMARSVSGVRATALLSDADATSEASVLSVSCEPDDADAVDAALARIAVEHDTAVSEPVEHVVDGLGALVVPLRAHLARAGALVALFDLLPSPPGTDERELLASFADQAGLALDRAQAVVDRGELAVISDRDRIARDLHDVVIQRLFATGLQLQGVASLVSDPAVGTRLERAVDELDLTIKAIRGTIFELQHRQSDSLRAEIRSLVREYVPVLGFSPAIVTSGPVDAAVTPQVREQLLPVLREAISNVARHALADQAQVEVYVSDNELRLTVIDDGIGVAEDRSESGLRNVRRRAAGLGGTVELTRNQPRGTTLVWRVPLASAGGRTRGPATPPG
ncbi:MAG: hypothetical protein JWR85_104 [Marmoricola sp.]|nr:hypothetical protein [Marmoricola sp.]